MRQMTLGTPREAIPPSARLRTCDMADELDLLWQEGDGGERSERRADLIAALKQLTLRQRALVVLVSAGYTEAEAYRRAYGHADAAHACDAYLAAVKRLRDLLNGVPERRGRPRKAAAGMAAAALPQAA